MSRTSSSSLFSPAVGRVGEGTVEHLVQLRVVDHSHVGTHLHPVWRQDGSQILFASDATGTAQLCAIDIAA